MQDASHRKKLKTDLPASSGCISCNNMWYNCILHHIYTVSQIENIWSECPACHKTCINDTIDTITRKIWRQIVINTSIYICCGFFSGFHFQNIFNQKSLCYAADWKLLSNQGLDISLKATDILDKKPFWSIATFCIMLLLSLLSHSHSYQWYSQIF